MKKVLITGGEGVLASYVARAFQKQRVFSPNRKALDITKYPSIEKYFKEIDPDVVIHLAAKTNVDECEQKTDEAFLVNAHGTRNIAKAAKKHQAKLVYVSSAAVFEGKKKVYFEKDRKNPVNVYGKSKAAGEEFIQETMDDYIIIRAAWLIGGGMKEKKFISYILDKLKTSEEVSVVHDKIGTVTSASELADEILELLSKNATGIYHFGSRGQASRFDIAKKIGKIIHSKAEIIPVSSSHFKSSFSAPRPNREVIGSKKIAYKNTWRQSLSNYIKSELLS